MDSLPYFARALFDYDAVEDTEMSVRKGDYMQIEEINDTGWCLGKIGDRAGWLPVDYVEKVNDLPSDQRAIVGIDAAPEIQAVEAPAQSHRGSVSASQPVVPTPVPEQKKPDPTPAPAPTPAPTPAAAPAPAAAAPPTQEMEQLAVDEPSDDPNAKRCQHCRRIIDAAFVVAKNFSFHPDCFKCTVCSKVLAGQPFIEKDDKFYCEDDYYAAFNPKCGACNEVIKGQYVSALNKSWHPEHFVCTVCKSPFDGAQFRKHDDMPYCDVHFNELFGVKCAKCTKNIVGQVFQAMNGKYHLECFVCSVGDHPIGEGVNFHIHENKFYCPEHFDEVFYKRCASCKTPIKAQYLKFGDSHYHPECWKCADCSTTLKGDTAVQVKSHWYCRNCATGARSRELSTMPPPPNASAPAKAAPAAPAAAAPVATPAPTPAPAVTAPVVTPVATPAPAVAATPAAAAPRPAPTATPTPAPAVGTPGAPRPVVQSTPKPVVNNDDAKSPEVLAKLKAQEAKIKQEEEAKQKAAAAPAPAAGGFTIFEVPYEQLVNGVTFPAGVDPSKRELYLRDRKSVV